jgi:hypothetical protein
MSAWVVAWCMFSSCTRRLVFAGCRSKVLSRAKWVNLHPGSLPPSVPKKPKNWTCSVHRLWVLLATSGSLFAHLLLQAWSRFLVEKPTATAPDVNTTCRSYLEASWDRLKSKIITLRKKKVFSILFLQESSISSFVLQMGAQVAQPWCMQAETAERDACIYIGSTCMHEEVKTCKQGEDEQ